MARKGISQLGLAELTGINRMALSRRLPVDGTYAFDTDDLVRIARALGVPLLEIVTKALAAEMAEPVAGSGPTHPTPTHPTPSRPTPTSPPTKAQRARAQQTA